MTEKERIAALEERLAVVEACLAEIEVRLKIRRKPKGPSLELPPPEGEPLA